MNQLAEDVLGKCIYGQHNSKAEYYAKWHDNGSQFILLQHPTPSAEMQRIINQPGHGSHGQVDGCVPALIYLTDKLTFRNIANSSFPEILKKDGHLIWWIFSIIRLYRLEKFLVKLFLRRHRSWCKFSEFIYTIIYCCQTTRMTTVYIEPWPSRGGDVNNTEVRGGRRTWWRSQRLFDQRGFKGGGPGGPGVKSLLGALPAY